MFFSALELPDSLEDTRGITGKLEGVKGLVGRPSKLPKCPALRRQEGLSLVYTAAGILYDQAQLARVKQVLQPPQVAQVDPRLYGLSYDDFLPPDHPVEVYGKMIPSAEISDDDVWEYYYSLGETALRPTQRGLKSEHRY